MIRMYQTVLIVFLFLSLTVMEKSEAQQPEIIKLPQLMDLLGPDTDTTYVINFWATWCKPCVKELPYFDKLASEFKDRKVKVLLLSLDFRRQYESRLIPFLEKHGVKSEVKLVDEIDYNSWIDKVDPSWSGAIPATIIINKSTGSKNFYEKEFTYSELKKVVEPIISN